jgi:hypothetical protein
MHPRFAVLTAIAIILLAVFSCSGQLPKRETTWYVVLQFEAPTLRVKDRRNKQSPQSRSVWRLLGCRVMWFRRVN